MGKKAPWSDWERIYYASQELCERRGDAIARVWMVIESEVLDAGLANSLRMAILGDIIDRDIVVYETDHEDIDESDLVEGEE